jgi:hypothetical protein
MVGGAQSKQSCHRMIETKARVLVLCNGKQKHFLRERNGAS